MSNYDIAAGASPAGLNGLIGNLFANAAVHAAYFSGTTTQPVDVIGDVTLTYAVKVAPTFVLQPPTQAQWNEAQKQPADLPMPGANLFQLVFSDLAASATVPEAPPLTAEGAFTAYATVVTQNGGVTLTAVGLLLDESHYSEWDKAIVNDLLIPTILTVVDKLVSNLPLPQLPGLGSLTFQPIAIGVGPQGLVVGTSLVGDPTIDLSGFAFPPGPLFVAVKVAALNKALVAAIPTPLEADGSTGPSAWKASGSITAENVTVSAAISNGLILDIAGTFSTYGELSGAGVGVAKAVLCPIGAAADAISNPSGWDKVKSEFKLDYSPNPMPVPVTVTVGAIAGMPAIQPITITVPPDQFAHAVRLSLSPKWSGSVTGTALAAAASAFADLVLLIFHQLIEEKLVSSFGHQTISLPVSKMTKTLQLPQGGQVTFALSVTVGAALQPFNNDQIWQAFGVTVS